ncbi:MAG: 3-dehydroquinate synthase [Dehalococcoidia bacterium]|nr:3-dehydroquinate synthase [Dehalococcoidia bacterium]
MDQDVILLVGLSGSGKSTVGRLVAARLGWGFVDTDQLVEEAAGRPIPQIFSGEGEAAFRERERLAVEDAVSRHNVVIATGGGAPTHAGTREALGRGFTVWLVVSPERAAARLAANPETEERPLLAGDPRTRLERLLADRKAFYELADAAVDVDSLTPEQAAAEIVRLWHEEREHNTGSRRRFGAEAAERPTAGHGVAAMVRTQAAGATYPVVVERGVLAELGAVCREQGLRGRAFVVTDTAVGPLFGEAVLGALHEAGYSTQAHAIPAGEEHKNLATVGTVFDWLLSHRVERSDFVVSLGGGVVTDLAGFAAATCLRGVDFVHVPTSLLAMVDASVGGKTGVDHAMGKNMIGAFAQPRAVVIDPAVLESLPRRQLVNGWAEVVKHGLILDAQLFADLEAVAGKPEAMIDAALIGRSVAIKAAVVSEDEREAGRRTLLNYGHTIGHAIEAVTGYSSYLHGEAVAVGMRVAGAMSVELGLLSAEEYERQQRVLRACGLPESAPGLDSDAVIAATRSDKKVRAGSVRWVLLEGIGQAAVHDDVPETLVQRAVAEALAAG